MKKTEIYKRAAIKKLRISTSRGGLTVEQLYDLNITELDELAVKLDADVASTVTKSFIKSTTTTEESLTKLRFDIVHDVLTTKLAAQETARKAQETKAHNQRIEALIQKKKEGALEEMSIEELEAMLQ